MPRSSVLLTPGPVSGDDVAAAAAAVWAQLRAADPALAVHELAVVDEGAALQVRTGAGEPVVTVLRSRLLPRPDEVARLLPSAAREEVADGSYWTEAYTPWTEAGSAGLVVLASLASAVGGRVHHSGSRPTD